MDVSQQILIISGLVILLLSVYPSSLFSQNLRDRGDDDLWIIFCVLIGGTLLWIAACRYMIHEPSFLPQYFSPQMHPLIFIGLLWPVCFGAFQMIDFFYDREENLEEATYYKNQINKGVKEEASSVTALVFAMGALIVFVGGGSPENRLQIMPAVRFFLIVVIICLGLVGTTHNLANNNNSRWAILWKVAQRLCVNLVIGLLLTALLMIFVISATPNHTHMHTLTE
jgi:hypothetical protein